MTVREARGPEELAAAMELRVRVFCGEQGVDHDEELDEHDATAIHMVAVDESGVVATCRLRLVEGDCKLERMAVDRSLRGSGVGAALLAGAESQARGLGAGRMVLHAQTQAKDFYASGGYDEAGEVFLEAGIEHVRMTKTLDAGA